MGRLVEFGEVWTRTPFPPAFVRLVERGIDVDWSMSPRSSYVREWYPRRGCFQLQERFKPPRLPKQTAVQRRKRPSRCSSHRRLAMEEATAASEAMFTVVWAWAWNETAGVPTSSCLSEDNAPGPSEE